MRITDIPACAFAQSRQHRATRVTDLRSRRRDFVTDMKRRSKHFSGVGRNHRCAARINLRGWSTSMDVASTFL
jgi:hypothetical protein